MACALQDGWQTRGSLRVTGGLQVPSLGLGPKGEPPQAPAMDQVHTLSHGPGVLHSRVQSPPNPSTACLNEVLLALAHSSTATLWSPP